MTRRSDDSRPAPPLSCGCVRENGEDFPGHSTVAGACSRTQPPARTTHVDRTARLQPRALCIISGGQTGADRAALDWAIAHQLPHGGWCPQGRRAEGGAIPACYCLRETRSVSYRVRTRRNVEAADATVLFTLGRALSEGTRYTAHVARRLGKPLLHLHKSGGVARSATLLDRFLERYPVAVLNIAGPRASQQPAVASFVQAVLTRARPLKGCGCSVPRGSLPQDVAGRVTRHCRYAVASFLSRSK